MHAWKLPWQLHHIPDIVTEWLPYFPGTTDACEVFNIALQLLPELVHFTIITSIKTKFKDEVGMAG